MNAMMKNGVIFVAKFYYTYGAAKHPFSGGWTVVIADNEPEAVRLFRAVHPDRTSGILNCASFYTEENFQRTSMFKSNSNIGHGLHEIIQKIIIEE